MPEHTQLSLSPEVARSLEVLHSEVLDLLIRSDRSKEKKKRTFVIEAPGESEGGAKVTIKATTRSASKRKAAAKAVQEAKAEKR